MNCVRRFRIKDYFVNVIQLMQFRIVDTHIGRQAECWHSLVSSA